MSKLNIYDTRWLDIVFEGRNKEYGAYQLRAENPKTTIKALFSGIFLLGSAIAIPIVLNSTHKKDDVAICNLPLAEPLTLVEVKLNEQLREAAAPKQETETPVGKQIKYTKLVPVTKANAATDIPTNREVENAIISTVTTEGEGTTSNTSITTTAPSNGTGTGTDDGNTIRNTVELEALPEFPGGMGEFLNAVGKRFKTPELEELKTLKVLVFFVIEKDGTLSNIRVTRDPGYGLGKEAIRVLNSIKTKWTPGYKNGHPVRTAYNLPITVNIN